MIFLILGILVRCTEVGISIRNLGLLTIGVIFDMWTEKALPKKCFKLIVNKSYMIQNYA